MRLYLVDKPNCRSMKDKMKGISIVYQMEQEFKPYLLVDFIPNHDNMKKGGVIIMAGKEVIKKPFTFDNPSEVEELRSILWSLLEKYHPNIHNKWPTSMVVDSWAEAKKEASVNCNIGASLLGDDVKTNVQYRRKLIQSAAEELANFYVRHWSLKDNFNGPSDYNSCLKARIQECDYNFPKGSQNYRICKDEIITLCKLGYKTNNLAIKNDYVEFIQNKLYKKLESQGFKVDKQLFDDIIDAGMLAEPDQRRLQKRSLIDIKEHFVAAINGNINNKSNKLNYIYMIIIILVSLGVLYKLQGSIGTSNL